MSNKNFKHGSRALQRILKSNALDRRTATAQAYYQLQTALADDRGGMSNCNAAEKILIERAAALTLICRAIESYALGGAIVDAAGTLSPALARGYTSHSAQLTRTLAALGIRPDKIERLQSIGELLEGEEPPP